MNKSFVGMGVELCPVCGQTHTESVLLDKRRKNTFGPDRVLTGVSLCPEHEAMREEYVALVEVSEQPKADTKAHDVKRTGNFAHVRRTAAAKIFDIDLSKTPLAYIEVGVIEKLQALPTAS